MSNKGYKHSEETKNKISIALNKPEIKLLISKKNKGKHHSPRTEFKLGNVSWLKGTKGIVKVNSGSFKKGMIPWCKGKKLSEEHKRNVSIGTIKAMGNSEVKKKIKDFWSSDIGKKLSKELRSKRIIPKKDTSIELKIQNYLKQLGIDFFTHQHMKQIEHAYQCDIWIPSMNLVIECDGDYWHSYPVRRSIDDIRTMELLAEGFKVLRLWETDINKMTLREFTEKIKNLPNRYEFHFAGNGRGKVNPIIEDKFTIMEVKN